MNSLFEEKTNSIRAYIFELMNEKQADLNTVRQEFEPQREFLRQKKAKGLLTEEEFRAALDRLHEEQTERENDVELEYSEKETRLNEEIEKVQIEAENEQKKLLKDRQTQEKLIMFKSLLSKCEENDAMKQYLEKEMKVAENELQKFARQQDKEKQKRIEELHAQKEQKMKDLVERQDRMFNWEEKMKSDEQKYVESFNRQKEELVAKKLADQQKELLKEMNQKDVDAMISKHKRELEQMDDALKKEQSRQLELMRERMKGRNA